MAGDYRLTLTAEIARFQDGTPTGERLTVTDELELAALDFAQAVKILGDLRELAKRRADESRERPAGPRR